MSKKHFPAEYPVGMNYSGEPLVGAALTNKQLEETRRDPNSVFTWLPNDPFAATLKIVRNYDYISLRDEVTGFNYSVTLDELLEHIENHGAGKGTITGTFQVYKQGVSWLLATV